MNQPVVELARRRAEQTKELTRAAVRAYRAKRSVVKEAPEPADMTNWRTDATGSPRESLNEGLLSQVRQAKNELVDEARKI